MTCKYFFVLPLASRLPLLAQPLTKPVAVQLALMSRPFERWSVS